MKSRAPDVDEARFLALDEAETKLQDLEGEETRFQGPEEDGVK
jgi:hypothetical protein